MLKEGPLYPSIFSQDAPVFLLLIHKLYLDRSEDSVKLGAGPVTCKTSSGVLNAFYSCDDAIEWSRRLSIPRNHYIIWSPRNDVALVFVGGSNAEGVKCTEFISGKIKEIKCLKHCRLI